MLTRNEFDLLVYLENAIDSYCINKMSEDLGISQVLVEEIIEKLVSKKLVDRKSILPQGIEALMPYKVKRAIFIAAGFGSRLVPITLNTPKPLIQARGKKIIETLLDAIVEVGITDIVIVRGYLSEQFNCLLKKYPNIKFIENSYYNQANNISSVYLTKELLENSYILEADLFLSNKKLITKYQYSSNYLGIKVEETNDWCFEMNNDKISGVKIGGENCPQMIGISYWDKEDGKRLLKDVEEVYKSAGGKERYWDEVPLRYKQGNYNVEVRYCKQEDIVEIDTFNELKVFDPIYDC